MASCKYLIYYKTPTKTPSDHLLQLIFQTVGWVGGSLLWNSLRPGVNSPDPELALTLTTEGLLNPEFSATNLALALGQVGGETLYSEY